MIGGVDQQRAFPKPLIGGAAIAAAAVAAYANTLGAPFVYDDLASIVANPTIRHLWPIWNSLRWPQGRGLTVEGRPLLNLSLALNYAISRDEVWSYHALNLVIHVLAGWCLFGIARRLLGSPRAAVLWGGKASVPATALGFAVALLWTVHPLQTESVTYTIQRAESLMGLCYLLTLYCFIRGTEAENGRWYAAAAAACLAGMATKEVMVSAPVIVFLYDRTFVSGTLWDAWRRHRRIHLCLAATWSLLAYLVFSTGGDRGGSAGFDVGVKWDAYALTQFQAVAHYLRLVFWPSPLVLDYGTFGVKDIAQAAPYVGLVATLVVLTAWALRAWPAWGFLGCWFFAILAPTSLIPGTAQMIVEHRMYVALAPVLLGLVGATFGLLERVCPSLRFPAYSVVFGSRAGWAILLVAVTALTALTIRRNAEYSTAVGLWSDTVAKAADNARARVHLGFELAKIPGRLPDAVVQYEEAVRLDPQLAEAEVNLANALAAMPGRRDEAMAHYERALRLNPELPETHYDLANLLATSPDRLPDAVAQYVAALRLDPNYVAARINLANLLATIPGRRFEAMAQYEQVLRIDPNDAEAHYDLANVLAETPGRMPEAVAQYEEALRLDPKLAAAEVNLANALATIPGRLSDAVTHYKAALRLRPDFATAELNLGIVLVELGRLTEAEDHLEAALHLDPGLTDAQALLARVRAAEWRRDSAR